MTAYYNEIDPYAAQWLRNLIAAGHIAFGDIDERSIVDVQPDDLRGYTQCHFFAGIGGWSLALRLAGIPDDRSVWTGSCPCQPFSGAGQGRATADERHLWPDWFRLVRAVRPPTIFGEQVEAAIGWGWIDLVCADLGAEGYTARFAVLPACGVGAPHIRQRLWFVGNSDCGDAAQEPARTDELGEQRAALRRRAVEHARAGAAGRNGGGTDPGGAAGRPDGTDAGASWAGLVADAGCGGDERGGQPGTASETSGGQQRQQPQDGGAGLMGDSNRRDTWANAVWLPCSDGKARPAQSGIFPLAHGVPSRVGRLRAYGNAIVPQVAAEFIRAAWDVMP